MHGKQGRENAGGLRMELYGARIGKWNNSMYEEQNSLDEKKKWFETVENRFLFDTIAPVYFHAFSLPGLYY